MEIVCESGVQFLERLEGRHSLKNLEDRLFDGKLDAGSLVEISGGSGVGKSELLLNLVTKCLLPSKLGGLLVKTLYIDNDHHFSMLRLVSILSSRISDIVSKDDDSMGPEDVHEQTIIDLALKNLRIVRCTSGIHFLTTLHYLDTITMNEDPITLLIIDSLSAFFWEDKMIHENQQSLEGHHRKIAFILKKIMVKHKVTVLCTNQDLIKYRNNEKQNQSEFGSALGPEISNLRTFVIRLIRDSNCNYNRVLAEVKHKSSSNVYFQIADGGIVFSS